MRIDDDLVVVTPWYPSPNHPYAGIFVQEWVRSLRHDPKRTTVIHLWRANPDDGPVDTTISSRQDPVGKVIHVPFTLPRRTNPADAVVATRRALEALDPAVLDKADIVHGHVGLPTAAATALVIAPEVPLVTIEHASYTSRVITEPRSRAAYARMLERSDQHLTVGEREARQLRAAFPATAHKVLTMGNPIDADAFPLGDSQPGPLNHWLYVGNLIDSKGAGEVLEAFARWCDLHPERPSTLRFVGKGRDASKYRERARTVGIDDRFSIDRPVPLTALHEVFAAADVLVHLSHGETFGLTMVEAAASGVPVVTSRSGGPEETLRYAADAGGAAFVDVGASPREVVKAVTSLERARASARRDDIRHQLIDRYGMKSFGARLGALPAGAAPKLIADNAHDALVIATGAAGSREAGHVCQTLLRAGASVRFITGEPADVAESDRRIEVRSLWPHLRWSPLRAFELTIGLVVMTTIRAPQFVARKLSRPPNPVRAIFAWIYSRLVPARRNATSGLARLHDRGFDRLCYQSGSGRLVAKYAFRTWSDLTDNPPDVVIYCDPKSAFLARELVRRHPNTTLMSLPSEQALEEIARTPTDAVTRHRDEP